MTQQELLKRVRRRLRDEAEDADQRLWSDEELIDDFANDARDKLFLLCRNIIIDSSTPEDDEGLPLCRLSVRAGTAQYAISPKIIETIRVKLSSQYWPLTRIMQDQLDLLCVNWQGVNPNVPWAWCPDLDTDTITLIPPPKDPDTAILTVSRFPLKKMAIAEKTLTVGFREEYQDDLIPWILYLAFSKKDAEADRPELAEYQRKIFIDRAQDIKMEIQRRLSGTHTNTPRRAYTSR